jgi:hypothetical protein
MIDTTKKIMDHINARIAQMIAATQSVMLTRKIGTRA